MADQCSQRKHNNKAKRTNKKEATTMKTKSPDGAHSEMVNRSQHSRVRSSLFWLAVFSLALSAAVRAATVEVRVGDGYYAPNDVTINAGDTVLWT